MIYLRKLEKLLDFLYLNFELRKNKEIIKEYLKFYNFYESLKL